MNLTKKEKIFLKGNRGILEDIYQKKIDDLKEKVFDMPPGEERNLEMRFIKEYKERIRNIKRISKETNRKEVTFI